MAEVEADWVSAVPAWRAYEQHVADVLTSEGWNCELSARGADGGVDIRARTPATDTVIVQVKRYATSAQTVTIRQIRDLAGAVVIDPGATRALLVTDKPLRSSVEDACRTAGIQIRLIPNSHAIPAPPADAFEQLWDQHVIPLAGTTVARPNGRTTKVLEVDDRGIARVTKRGARQFVPIEAFAIVVRQTLEHGRYPKTEFRLSDDYGRYSAIVFDLLAALPMFALSGRPAALVHNRAGSA